MKELLNNKYTIKNKEVCPFCLNRTKGNSPKRLDGLYEGYGNFWILKCKKGHEWNRLEFEFLNGKQQKIIYQSKLSGYSLITSTTIISGYSLTTPTTINYSMINYSMYVTRNVLDGKISKIY